MTRRLFPPAAVAVVGLVGLVLAGCGGASNSASPAAPSSVATGGAAGATGAAAEATAAGQVSRLAGTCPDLTMAVNGSVVRTTADTRYEAGSCALVRIGAQVRAAGTMRGTTLVAARMAVSTPQR